MTIQVANANQVLKIADSFGFDLSLEDAQSFAGMMPVLKESYDRVDALAEPTLPVKYPRQPGFRPSPRDNPHNAWYWKTDLKGADAGPLLGKRIALKDNICVAGVPMMNGSRVLEGYVPEVDATVVTRILDAGATIVGKAACEDLCFSGTSHTCATGPIKNPHKPTHSAGGSSSGSAVVLVTGEADMALGGDQGGSIRLPSSWSGVYGLKPTHGLVPYTGIMPMEVTIDHCGPMANSVADVAQLLSVIAGVDGLDPRQIDTKTQDYTADLGQGPQGLKIAVLKEGFGRPESEDLTDQKVREAIERLQSAGASVSEISEPRHIDAYHVWAVICVDGATNMMIKGNGFGTGWSGHYVTSLLDAFARGWRSRPDDLSDPVKLTLFMGEYIHNRYHGRFYAKAQNLKRVMRQAYDDVLANYDVIAMPTVPFRATELPAPDCSREEFVSIALSNLGNTGPFDMTGHPAINVPCGMAGDLPIGLMLVGKRHDEATVLRAAAAFEGLGDWRTM